MWLSVARVEIVLKFVAEAAILETVSLYSRGQRFLFT
jgi:hypothetical protein